MRRGRESAGLVGFLALVLAIAGCTASSETPAPSTSPASSAGSSDASEEFTPIVGSVLSAPQIAPSTDGKVHLAYELMLSNVLSIPVTLEEVTVRDPGGAALLTLADDDLSQWVRVFGGELGGRVLGPGQQALVWLDVTVADVADVPADLVHEIRIAPESEIPPIVQTTMTETLAPTAVDRTPPVVIGPPLRGAGWLDGNSCCSVTPHRAAVNPINGRLYAPERFAVDYVRLDAAGMTVDGPVTSLESYPYEGADVLAVADGTIVSMTWDLPEQDPGANPSGLTLAEYGGNHVVLDIGEGRYAFYAHLQPGNPQGLTVGQRVSRGDVLGTLGNSGNSSGPHLHFHVMDSPLPLGSNGLPFAIDEFRLVGTVTPDSRDACIEGAAACVVDDTGAGSRTAQSPLFGDVMDYAD